MKKPLLAIGLVGSVLLAGCQGSMLRDNDKDQSPRAVTCKSIRRQMIYNSHNNNVQAKWLARSQRDRLKQLYKENECDKLDK